MWNRVLGFGSQPNLIVINEIKVVLPHLFFYFKVIT